MMDSELKLTRKVLTEKSPYLLILVDNPEYGYLYHMKKFVVEKFILKLEAYLDGTLINTEETTYRLIDTDVLFETKYCKIIKHV